jgi:hypothetical protein
MVFVKISTVEEGTPFRILLERSSYSSPEFFISGFPALQRNAGMERLKRG